jgi:uncharacterized repeat protein (TIGR03803 family)
MSHLSWVHRCSCAFYLVASAIVLICVTSLSAQTYHVLYTFTGGLDGEAPASGVTMDAAGNLYGTAANGGSQGYGTVFKLTHRGSSWLLAPLHSFTGNDGAYPGARVVFGPNGSLYGTTSIGGEGCGGEGCGVIYRLNPPTTICPTVSCPWTLHVVHYFGGSEGYSPYSEVTFGPDGTMYGTTYAGGPGGFGSVYAYGPVGSGAIYGFTGGDEGLSPEAPVILDAAGNLYGTTTAGFHNSGAVFKLARTGSGFQIHALEQFHDGVPVGGLIFDNQGNLYGTSNGGGTQNGGIVFELAGGTNFLVLWNIFGFHGGGPMTSLVRDASGNLYGVNTYNGAHGDGSVFKLSQVGGVWHYTDLYDFTGGTDGSTPFGQVVVDAQGNVFGTTLEGGSGCPERTGCGVIFEITPN